MRVALCLPVAVAALLSIAPAARALDADSITFFGDSLTDEGRNGRTAPVLWSQVFRTDTSITAGANYAIGGATTSNQPSATFGDSSYLGQVNSFIASGTPASLNAAAGIWIGTNNVQIGAARGVAATTIAAGASSDVRTGIAQLAGVGVRQVVLLGVYDLSLTNAFVAAGVNTLAVRGTAAAASQLYNAQLAALSVPGTSIQFFNIASFIFHLQSDAAAYGFQRILPLAPGVACNATCQQTSIFDDTIHLSAHTQTLIGDYVASGNPIYNGLAFSYGGIVDDLANAAVSAPIPQQMERAAADGFVTSIFERLDATRYATPLGPAGDPTQGRSAYEAGPPAAHALQTYAYGSVDGGTIARVGSAAGYGAGVDPTLAGVTVGADYQLTPTARVGAAFNYAHADSNLDAAIGTSTSLDAFQGALYGSLTRNAFFLDAIATGGSEDFRQTRYGTFGRLTASPNGDTFTASFRSGFLPLVGAGALGPIRVGPVGGLSYLRARVDGYADHEDSFYALRVDGQTVDRLVASVGGEVRLAGPLWRLLDPFLAITYERQLLRGADPIASTFASLPTQQLPATFVTDGATNAAKLAAGTEIILGPAWHATLTAFGVLGQGDIDVYGVNAGLSYRF